MNPPEPPEPTCARCRQPYDPDESKCPHCGFDGSEDTCVVCKKPIAPSSGNYGYSICESCELQGHKRRWENEDYPDFEEEPYEELPRDVENELYAISVGCTTEEEIDALYNNKPEEGDAS